MVNSIDEEILINKLKFALLEHMILQLKEELINQLDDDS